MSQYIMSLTNYVKTNFKNDTLQNQCLHHGNPLFGLVH